jgi:hypothetical protein
MISDSIRCLFPQLLDNGYIPIPNRDKECWLPKWSKIYVDQAQARRWTRQSRWPAIGLRIEPPLLVLDYDIPSEAIMAVFRHIVPAAALKGLERTGRPPKTAFFLRMSEDDEPFHKLSTRRYLLGKTAFAVEAFAGGGGGKQFGAFGPHSHDDAGNVLHTYTWVNDRSPANVPVGDLPVMTRAEVAAAIDRADELLAAWPGLAADTLSKHGEHATSQEYDITDAMVFTDTDGCAYTLDELTGEAQARARLKQPALRITGSFTGDPNSSGSARAKVSWSRRTGLSIHDFKTDTTHRVLRVPDDPELDKLMAEVFGEAGHG